MPTLGYNEKHDIRTVVRYLWEYGAVSSIGLWGRSMGAVACLLYAAEDPAITYVVADSPYSSLKQLCLDYLAQHFRLPRLLARFFCKQLRETMKSKLGVDAKDVS